ncbi:hypothetical protein R1flu_010936 [Riccia fluitans]|uniref:Uncharacterized protein n=1 Tax=Riccia fluitans TaxID=41844 RepID=A0ABD1Z6D7_9MARC
MENEASWGLQGDVLSEQPMLAAGRLLTSNIWGARLPDFYNLLDESSRVMPLVHSSSALFTSLSAKRPYTPWLESSSSEKSPTSSSSSNIIRKRPRVKSSSFNWDRLTSSRQLASFPCSVSPAENPELVACVEETNCPKNCRNATSDPHGTDFQTPKSGTIGVEKCLNTGASLGFSEGMIPSPMTAEERIRSDETWELRVVASSVCKSPTLVASDVIGTIDFNTDGELFATGGIARKIRICSYAKMTETRRSSDEEDGELSSDEDDDDDDVSRRNSNNGYCSRRRSVRWNDGQTLDHGDFAVAEICTPGKLSSVKWRPDGSEVIGCGDYDGVVSEWDIEHKHTVSEWYEHSGQRVWSLDYSSLTPTLSASASGDGTVRLWNRGLERSISTIRPPSGNSLCCAEFSPYSPYQIAIASADSNIYLYDLRNTDSCLLRLAGHEKSVSYVRFFAKEKLVSASVDSTLKQWDISSFQSAAPAIVPGDGLLDRTFREHLNVKNFVGLSVLRGAGVVACGSETNEVFFYRDRSSVPIQRYKFPSNGYRGSRENPFIGAVCWREVGSSYSIVAANSEGVVQVLEVQQQKKN